MTKIGIVGGGIIGLTTAFVLQKKLDTSSRDGTVELFEMNDELGRKSTTAAGCGLRTVYDHPTNVELARKGINFWSNAEDILGKDIGFRRNGYAFLTDDSESQEQFDDLKSKQESYGIPCEVEQPPKKRRGIPNLKKQNYSSLLYSPTAALASPERMVNALQESLDKLDTNVRLGIEVRDVDNNGDGVDLFTDKMGRQEFDYVINACGSWSQNIANMVGSELPTRNSPRRLSVLDLKVDRDAPLTVDIDTGVYVLPSESGDAMVGGHLTDSFRDVNPDHPKAFSDQQDPEWNRSFSQQSNRLSKDISSANVKDSWTGLYSITPSRIPIIDDDNQLIHATGFSGHGIMHAPGAAMIIDRMVSDSSHRLDMIGSLSKDRGNLESDIQF